MLMELKTIACTICGEEWSDTADECLVAATKQHQFIELMDRLEQGIKDTLVCKICGMERGHNINCRVSYNQQHEFVVVQVSY